MFARICPLYINLFKSIELLLPQYQLPRWLVYILFFLWFNSLVYDTHKTTFLEPKTKNARQANGKANGVGHKQFVFHISNIKTQSLKICKGPCMYKVQNVLVPKKAWIYWEAWKKSNSNIRARSNKKSYETTSLYISK